MPIFTPETNDAWQELFDRVSAQRPSVGKRVQVVSGKYAGKSGIVTWHGRNKFANDYYRTDAQLTIRDACGREGFRVRVDGPDGAFFVDADKVNVETEVNQ